MELLLQALPQEVLSKIMWYTLESPHTDLECGILKHAMGAPIYNKLVNKGGIVKDKNGHVVKVNTTVLSWGTERKSIKFDIAVLGSLSNLTEVNLQDTRVFGNIQVLQGLQNLIKFYLSGMIFGDIQVLQGLRNLTSLWLGSTGVTGDIEVLQELPNLTAFSLRDTRVTGNTCSDGTAVKEAFHNYRKSHGLEECKVLM